MDEKEFKELFAAIHPGDVWELRKKNIAGILEGLLNGEFLDLIEERKYLIIITKLEKGVNALVRYGADPVTIKLNSERWEKHPELNDHDIKESLRHELLHVALKTGDEDPLFTLEAKRRNIKINFPQARGKAW